MINSKSPGNIGPYKQLGLFDNPSSDPGPAIKAAMNESIRSCSLSREQIVDSMNKLAVIAGITCNGRSKQITVALLDKWVAPSATGYFIPLRLLPVFCRAVNSNLALQAFATFFDGIKIIATAEFKTLEWAKAEIGARRYRKQASRLAQEVL